MKLDRPRWLAIFFATMFVVGWAPVLVALANGHAVESKVGRAVLVFHAFGPLVGAALCTVLAPRTEAPLRSLGLTLDLSLPWFVAWGLPLVMTFIALGVCALFGASPLTTAEARSRSCD